MQKKLIALAVAGMATAPVFAADMGSGVTLYGRLSLGFDQYKATGATAGGAADWKSRNRVWDNGSRLGVRGTEDLGGGMKAIFLIESGVAVDTAGAGTATSAGLSQVGGANTATGALGSREAWVGLQGNWGTVKLGKQNVWWTNSSINQVQANFLEVGTPLNSSHGHISAGSTRTNNVVHYQTPDFSGFNASLYYSSQPTTTAGQESAAAGVDPKTNLWATTLRYRNGPIVGQFDYAKWKDLGNVGGVSITGYKLGGAYSYAPGSQIGLIWSRLKADNQAGIAGIAAAGDDIKSDAWNLEWNHTFGNIMAIAEYGYLGQLKGASISGSNTGAKYYNIGGNYMFSKRTKLVFQYAEIRNEANNHVDYNGGGMGVLLPLASNGADPRIISVGVQHNF